MPIRPRGSSWQADVRHNGERVRATFGTERESRIWEKQALADVAAGRAPTKPEHFREISKGYTLGDLLAEVIKIDWRHKKAGPTLIRNGKLVTAYFGEDRDVRTITKRDVDTFIDHLFGTNAAGATVNRKTAALSRIFRQAREVDPTVVTPKIERQRESEPRSRVYDDDEECRILTTLDLWGKTAERDLVTFLFETGCRVSEALNLSWQNLSATVVTIGANGRATGQRRARFTPAILESVGASQRLVVEATFTETKADLTRTIPLTKKAVEAMTRRHRAVGQVTTKPFENLSRFDMSHLWLRLREHLDLGPEATIHTIRHTTISRLASAGMDAFKLQKWAGHRTIITTQRYVHRSPRDLDSLMAALEARNG